MIKLAPLVELLPNATRTTSGTGSVIINTADIMSADILLLTTFVTNNAGTTPTLDIAIQNGANTSGWWNLARFTQITTGSNLVKYIQLKRGLALATEVSGDSDPAVGTGLLVTNIEWLNYFRIKWTIGGGSPSYDFGVWAIPLHSYGR